MRRLPLPLIAASLCLAAGCNVKLPLKNERPSDQPIAPAAAAPQDQPQDQPQQASQDEATRRKADVGVGRRGRSLDDQTGVGRMIVQPARSYFATKERLTFQVQIPQAMQLYEAANGQAPQSHEEFMQQIIEANRIPLPELRPNQKYVYDPKTKELMVEGPAR